MDDNTFKPFYESCKNCSGIGNKIDNKCISCKPGFTFIDFENDNNKIINMNIKILAMNNAQIILLIFLVINIYVWMKII